MPTNIFDTLRTVTQLQNQPSPLKQKQKKEDIQNKNWYIQNLKNIKQQLNFNQKFPSYNFSGDKKQ